MVLPEFTILIPVYKNTQSSLQQSGMKTRMKVRNTTINTTMYWFNTVYAPYRCWRMSSAPSPAYQCGTASRRDTGVVETADWDNVCRQDRRLGDTHKTYIGWYSPSQDHMEPRHPPCNDNLADHSLSLVVSRHHQLEHCTAVTQTKSVLITVNTSFTR